MRTPKNKQKNFSKKLIEQTETSARIINVFENYGFEVESMDQFQQIIADLFSVLSGGRTGVRKGPGRPAGKRGPGRPAGKRGPGRPVGSGKRGPGRPVGSGKKGPGRPPGKKGPGRPAGKRGPGRPAGKKRGPKPQKPVETPVTTEA